MNATPTKTGSGAAAAPAHEANPHAQEWARLDAGVPLALLPVRLETRFVAGELLIRIDPDVPHHDMHVPVLRADEKALAQQFWADVAAGKSADASAAAWRTLAAALGPWRAAWAARALKLGLPEGSERGRPALARLLPARWVAKAWFGGQDVVLGWTQKVRAPLKLGLDIDDPHWADEAALAADETEGRLRLDPGARWLTDFSEAEACGMALRVALARLPALKAHLDAGKPIDEVLVVGVDSDLDAASAGTRLAQLLDAHRYARGLELVAQGVPTNNTEQVRSGVSPSKPDLDGLLQRELRPWLPGGAPAAPVAPQTQGGRLARALGLDRAALVQRLEQAELRPDDAAAAMNRLIWPLGFGELFEKLLAGSAEPERNCLVDRAAISPLKDWYATHVRGGSALATLRMGAQPFGVLPVRRLAPRSTGMTQGSLSRHVNDAVHLLRETWREVLPLVPTVRSAGAADDGQAALLDVLARQPHPWEFTVQRASDCREVLVNEYAACNWAAAQHAPMLAGFMPNLRFGEPGRGSLQFIHALFGGTAAPAPNTADKFLGMLACWAKLLCVNTARDALPGIVASPSDAFKALPAGALEGPWESSWNLDALQWQAALAGRPLPPVARTLKDLIAYIDWLLGNPNWLVEVLKPEGVWAAYHTGLLKRKLVLEKVPAASHSAGQSAELAHCQAMLDRLGDDKSQSVPQLLRQARAALVLHGQRLAALEPLYAQWGRGSRLATHLQHDGPTAAYLSFEDTAVAAWPKAAALVQPAGASNGEQARNYLAELANTASPAAAAPWDAARVAAFASAARTASGAGALAGYRAQGMAPQRVPPLLFQLARAALAATSGPEQEQIRRQLQALSAFEPGDLELRLRETLGLMTHRLDAFATGLANEALFALRDKRPTGLQMGAYGWVENLRRDERLRDSQGHLLAPSMAHAATAAVLRAGWQAFGKGQDPGLAVDLSSARVRTGQALIEGLRAGRPLGELLGCRFERALHDHKLDRWIEPLRSRVASATGHGDARQPVDGLDLWNLWDADDAELKAMAKEVHAELDGLGEQIDALLDLSTAENVYQLVQGNMPRLAASLDALGQPDADPPPCTFADTPRPGRTITHRLLLGLPEGTAVTAGEGWADSPRALAAPALERWARLALGPATRFRLASRWRDGEGKALAPNTAVPASALGLSALDTIFLSSDEPDGGPGWRARLMAAVPLPTAAARPWRLELLPDAREGLAAGEWPASMLLGLARRLRRLLGQTTPADARHLARDGDNAAPGTRLDAAEFTARADAVLQRLAALRTRLDALLPRPPSGATGTAAATAATDPEAEQQAWLAHVLTRGLDAPALRAQLLEAARWGEVTHPLCGLARAGDADHESDLRELARLGLAASRGLAARHARASAAAQRMGKGDADQRTEAAREVFSAALGREMPVPAAFRLNDTAGLAAELAASLAVSGARPGEGPGARLHWLGQAAKVRPHAANLADALLQRAGAGVGGALDWHTAQLPHVLMQAAPEPWAATAAPHDDRRSRVCITVCGSRPLPAAAMQALLVDQWSEQIPDGRQTTALAFHYDAPASRPPQAILLAVVPEGKTAWSCDDVVETVRETLEWSRLRAVGPAELAKAAQPLGQFLPALYSSVPFELSGTLLAGPAGLNHRWRLEGKTSTEDLEQGTRACIADPMWMLSRQWQVGEFQGEDASMPVAAQVELETTPLLSLRCEPGGKLNARPTALAMPDAAEALVEAQDPARCGGAYAWWAQAGLGFLAMLREAGQPALADRVRAAFISPPPPQEAELGAADRQALAELAASAPAGQALALALRADPRLTATVTASEAERAALAPLAASWLAQLDTAAALPAAGVNGWNPERMAYGLSLAAAGPKGELVLRAAEYVGGRLEAAAFDLAAGGGHGLAATPARRRMHVRIPTPMRYPGMPADRYWEFEDRDVDLGGMQATPADLPRMMLAGFATCYSDDWFSLPITLASGQLARVRSLRVVDALGMAHAIPPLAAQDHRANPKSRPWRLFELSGDEGPAEGLAPWLMLASALPDTLDGPVLEQVQFMRDEVSNLVWAMERQIESPLGTALDRVQAWQTSRAPAEPAPPGRWRYQVAPPLPSYCVPLLPERDASAQVRLRRGRLHQGLDGSGRAITSGARGRILDPGGDGAPLRIHEDEVPATGVEVSRAWQLARDREGRVWLWLGQRRRSTRATKLPGLEFDRIGRR